MQASTIPLFSDSTSSFLQMTLEINNHALRGTTKRHGVDFTLIDEGVLLIEPDSTNQPSSNLVLSAGVHGNETAPIELLDYLVSQLLKGAIQLKCRLLLILGNPPAMRNNQRFITTNLNRLFNRSLPDGNSQEASRARQLMQHVDDFFSNSQGARYHYDLHTAIRGSEYEKFAVYPHNLREQPWSQQQIEFLGGCDIAAVLFQKQPSPTFSWYSGQQHDAAAFTLELGKARPFGTNDPHSLDAISHNLTCLMEDKTTQQSPIESVRLFAIRDQIIRHGEQFELLFPDELPNFSKFMPGSLLSRDDDQCYTVTGSPGYIIFPNANVELGARAALVAEDVDASSLFKDQPAS